MQITERPTSLFLTGRFTAWVGKYVAVLPRDEHDKQKAEIKRLQYIENAARVAVQRGDAAGYAVLGEALSSDNGGSNE